MTSATKLRRVSRKPERYDSADTRIAGKKTVGDWQTLQRSLAGADAETWKKTFDDYFIQRLETRYFEPIKALQGYGARKGEGFSIVAIQCSLIEFLESVLQGKNYCHWQKGVELGPYEYSDSQKIFVSFLYKRQPFASIFTRKTAKNFYVNVRCGLLHEARTKGGWKIRAKAPDGSAVNVKYKIVYRDGLQKALEKSIQIHRAEIQKDLELQQAFIRKYDHLCE